MGRIRAVRSRAVPILGLIAGLWIGIAAAADAKAADTLPGPYPAEVVSVYDGDTFTARIHIWLDLYTETSVRVVGVDTPEIRGRCAAEIMRAKRARYRAEELLAGEVMLYDVGREK